jgi:glutathione synthase/RimK-type ligase-like ATP-grasp enzyme
MKTLIVVDQESEWPEEIPGAAVASAKAYLTDAAFANGSCERVVNLCRSDRLQGPGFYVSLLAEARGHQPLPSAKTLEDLRGELAATPELAEIEERFEQEPPGEGPELEVLSYFGCDPQGRHGALCERLFELFKAPLLRARLRLSEGRWRFERLETLGAADVPPEHREIVQRAAAQFLKGESRPHASHGVPALAILHTPGEPLPPSNAAALQSFVRAAKHLGMRAEIIGRDAIDRLEQFDALFIRDTTYLEHYTYRFAQRAQALGMVVIDDPESILQCNNKVYLNELLGRHGIPVPKTLMVHRDNIGDIAPALGLPCILKQPDGGFSLGVRKASTEEELSRETLELLEKSELIIAQEFLPTAYDWRVTVLERRPLFVCQYFMAPGHWQVHKYERERHLEGRTVALSVGEAPRHVVETALKAANLIGDGLYGVDLKEIRTQAGSQCCVMEINDNPNIDAGNEDGVLKDALYREVMAVFLRRIGERHAMAA